MFYKPMQLCLSDPAGGGLFDQEGQLIGITNSVDRNSKNIAFAIPTEWINQILFPKSQAAEKTPSMPADNQKKTVTKMGEFGKGNIAIYQYNQKCFLYFQGKNEYGEAAGSAVWYPEKPGIILIFPQSKDINKNFKIMNEAFYGDKEGNPSYSGNYLYLEGKKYELVGIKDENGRYPLLVTKLPADSKEKFSKIKSFDVEYGDNMTVQGYGKVSYGLTGYADSLSAYAKQCKIARPQ